MKNIKALGLLFLALMVGLAAAVYAANWVSSQGSILSNKIVVAAVDIELGGRINPQMLTTTILLDEILPWLDTQFAAYTAAARPTINARNNSPKALMFFITDFQSVVA